MNAGHALAESQAGLHVLNKFENGFSGGADRGVGAGHFQGLNQRHASGDHGTQLVIQLGAAIELTGRDNHTITKTQKREITNQFAREPKDEDGRLEFAQCRKVSGVPANSRRDAVEAGLEIAFAARADDLVSDLAFVEKQQGGYGADAVFGRK